ncbi:MAG: DUF1269 domain-containing protein [Chloroflexia bacterium]|nr:DUF1269 domain-containing protein [Chloroflexia bacterium]
MSELVAIAFDREDDAHQALTEMRVLEGEGVLKLTDSAVVAKDRDGTLQIKNEVSSGTETGAVVGGAIGLLTSFLFPVAGAVVGAAAGAYIGGKVAGDAVDDGFVKDVGAALQPDTSALFLMIRASDAAALRAALEPYEGRVYQTTLSEELKESLDRALR